MDENQKNQGTIKNSRVVLIVIITIICTILGTVFVINTFNITPNKESINVDYNNILEDYRKMIDKYYLGEINEADLIDGVIKGYVEGLGDPYTEYISKDEMEEYMESTLGNFVGVGIYMVENVDVDRIQILSPIKNGPAEEAGILPGDYIITINGEEVTAEDIDLAPNKIKGEPGTIVTLEIARDGEEELLKFELIREEIIVNPVDAEVLENNTGYISFNSFDENTAEEFKNKYLELEKQGIDSLVIDLRNNGGGIVNESLEIADYIVEKDQVLLYEVDKNGKELVETSKLDPIINLPVVVLVNGNTASSSEIVAGILQDYEKATIVGETTFGKGVIQQILELSDGSGMKITSAKYLTPDKREIDKIGIEPDVIVELPLDVEEDTQLQKALEILK